MKVFSATDYPQGSPQWHELRRGIPTASGADKILTAKRMQFSSQAETYLDELLADIVNPSANWFTENMSKPPNRAIQNGIEMEAEAKWFYAMEKNVDIWDVGFVLSDCGRYGCSPDAVGKDFGVEIKAPMLKTQSRYVRNPNELLDDYKCQTNFQLLVAGWKYVDLLSYSPPLPAVCVRVEPSVFTEAMREALFKFLDMLAAAKRALGIPDRVTADGEILTGLTPQE